MIFIVSLQSLGTSKLQCSYKAYLHGLQPSKQYKSIGISKHIQNRLSLHFQKNHSWIIHVMFLYINWLSYTNLSSRCFYSKPTKITDFTALIIQSTNDSFSLFLPIYNLTVQETNSNCFLSRNCLLLKCAKLILFGNKTMRTIHFQNQLLVS